MSNKQLNNGGPAFPLPVEDLQCRARFESGYGGMTLRDYFAAKAMQALISKHGFISDEINFAAAHSYEIADAMLKVREGGAMTDNIKLPPLPKASKMYDIPGYDEEELKDYARAAILADRASRDPSPPAESESNYPIKYYKQGGVIYAVHGTSSINCVERLLAKIADLETELENERTLRTAALDTVRVAREGRDALREVLSKILENEASDYKAAEEYGGYVLDDELREEARAVLAKWGQS